MNIKTFDGEKYSVWKIRIRAYLEQLAVLTVIDDKKPGKISPEWINSDAIARNTIIKYLADSHLGFAKPGSSAQEILKSLDEVYERKTLAAQLNVRKKLLSLKLQDGITLVKHFAAFDELIAELSAAVRVLEETEKIAHLLHTLPAEYDGIIMTELEFLSDDNVNLEFVKARILDYEIILKYKNSAKLLQAKQGNAASNFKDYESKNLDI